MTTVVGKTFGHHRLHGTNGHWFSGFLEKQRKHCSLPLYIGIININVFNCLLYSCSCICSK